MVAHNTQNVLGKATSDGSIGRTHYAYIHSGVVGWDDRSEMSDQR